VGQNSVIALTAPRNYEGKDRSIAIAVLVAMVFLREQIQNIFSNIGNNLT
jgi:hypothetical protein